MTQNVQPVFQVLARFQPQAWVEGVAVDVDGARDVDVTDKLLQFAQADPAWLRDLEDASDSSDDLIGSPRTQGHDGPFTVAVVQAAAIAFGVEALDEVTQEMVRKRWTARRDVELAEESAGSRGASVDACEAIEPAPQPLPAPTRPQQLNSRPKAPASASAAPARGRRRTSLSVHVEGHWFVDAAQRHGQRSGADREVGDLRAFFLAAWDVMAPDQRRTLLSNPVVQETVVGATGTVLARKLSDIHQGEWAATVADQQLPHGLRRNALSRQEVLDCVNARRLESATGRD